MNVVFLQMCTALGLTDGKAPAIEEVAKKVIELGGPDTRDSDPLRGGR